MGAKTQTSDERLEALGIHLPDPPVPFGAYVPSVQSGGLLFLSGTLATSGHAATARGVLGRDLDVEGGRKAALAAALNALALTREHLGTLDRVARVVRLGVYLVADQGFTDHPKVADAVSELFREIFGNDAVSTRLVFGVASLPLGSPVELEVIMEVKR